jgi:hypothetical protein
MNILNAAALKWGQTRCVFWIHKRREVIGLTLSFFFAIPDHLTFYEPIIRIRMSRRKCLDDFSVVFFFPFCLHSSQPFIRADQLGQFWLWLLLLHIGSVMHTRNQLERATGITLGETHDEYDVNSDETQQISHNHSVNHDDERPNFLEASAIS